MSANNVALEHASLWVQIWGVPFDLMSPKVAAKVGNKMGSVEDMERRRRTDDRKFFLSVRVALPISKPVQRGGFLLGSDGKRHWVTFKYERLPMFCHFCGILGHDLCHCPAHFAATKETDNVDYQYGEWLKANSGRTKSPPRQSRENPMKSDLVGRADTSESENDEKTEVVMVGTRVSKYRAGQDARNGNCVVEGSVAEFPEKILVVNAAINANEDDKVPLLPLNEAGNQNLNSVANGKSNMDNSRLGHAEAKPNRPKPTWTRLNRMDSGPVVSSNNNLKSIVGKRGLEDFLYEDNSREAEPTYSKRSKGDKEDGKPDNTAAGVDDHPCREQ